MKLEICRASKSDIQAALPFIQNIIAAGETYALDNNMSDQEIEGYFFRDANHAYKMVSEKARGKGVARSMAQHALNTAERLPG